jgi:Holliday junction resolvase RusA-like endonuclease
VIRISVKCVPPSITAQMKRVHVVHGKPVFFHGTAMQQQAATWTSLLQPYQPAEPMDGPLALDVRLVYPHLKATPKRDVHRLLPKTSKPDAGNASKHLEDLLTRLRFIADDARVARLVVEKFHGPESHVGIQIRIAPFTPERLSPL